MYDEEIEKAVLFYIIFENAEFDVTEEDFVNHRNRMIIKAIIQLKNSNQQISMLNITNLIKGKKEDVLNYISNLGEFIYGFSQEIAYNKLINFSKKRKTYNLIKSCEKEIKSIDDIDIMIEKYKKELTNIQSRNEKKTNFQDQVMATMGEIEKNYNSKGDFSLYTGVLALDKKILGLHKQELTIIGARPGIGKTTLALQITQNIAQKGKHVGFISLEMADVQMIQKMISRNCYVNSYNMRAGVLVEEDFQKISESCNVLSSLPIHLITKAKTIQDIEVEARKMKNNCELDLLIIDYIQLLKNKEKFGSREQEVADISRTLKLLSLELEIPIIGLCQLNRNANKNEPTLADLRESGSLEQDADNVFFLYSEDNDEEKLNPTVVLKIAKQRAGDVGKIYLRFRKGESDFVSLIRENK